MIQQLQEIYANKRISNIIILALVALLIIPPVRRRLRITLKNLEYYLCICHHLSFVKAADELFVSVQGLNLSINRMEQDLNTKLFLRTSEGLKLTDSGRLLQDTARNIFSELSCFYEKLEKNNLIYIACMHQLIAIFPEQAQKMFLNLDTGFQVKVIEAPSFECEEMLRCGKVDFAISCDPIPTNTFISNKLFIVHPLAVVNTDSPLADSEYIDINLLKKDVQIACLSKNNKLYHLFIKACLDHCFNPDIIFEAGYPSIICDIVRKNKNIVGIIPEYYQSTLGASNISFIRFPPDELTANTYLLKSPTRRLPQYALDFEKCFLKYIEAMC
ncbi:MAG: LysR family transcriptional regulator [Oscillospiraceae bacterium]|nr:LysR family transcriptional regulator [Oscillospiraceae bacterium]